MRNTIILFIVALALGAYVYFYEIEGEEERQAEAALKEKLIAVNKDSINIITINDFEKVFRFEKKNGTWMITQPVETEAEESTVTSFLSSLANAKKSRTFNSDPSQLSSYGLKNAAIRVKVETESGKQDSIHFGDKTSIGEDMYTSKGDTSVFISPISLKNAAQKSLFAWRDKKAVHFTKNTVQLFNLKSGKNEFSFEKDGSDWMMTKPVSAKADMNQVNEVLNKLDFGRVKSVASEQGANLFKFNLANPYYKIELFSGSEKAKSTVSFSRLKDNLSYGKDEVRPHVFTVDSNFIKPFKKSVFDFRDKDLVDFDRSSIDRINFLHNSELLMFNKDTSGTWQISTGESIKSNKITTMINSLDNLKVDAFIAHNPSYTFPYGLTTPKGKIELFAGEDKAVELEIGISKNKKTYMKNPRTGWVIAVKDDKLKDVFIKLSDILEDSENTRTN